MDAPTDDGAGPGGAPDGPGSEDRREGWHTRRERSLLTLFFVLHFGAILVYVAPASPGSYSTLAPPFRVAVSRTVSPAVRALRPVATPYLNAFSLHQHWGLFAPDPIRWSSSLEVTAYFPADTAARDPAERWRSETIRLEGPREAPLPHWGHNRWYRIVLNMGYEGWGRAYRPLFARGLCERLEDERGRRPEGLTITSIWVRVRVPWREAAGHDVYRQPLGGWECEAAGDGDAR